LKYRDIILSGNTHHAVLRPSYMTVCGVVIIGVPVSCVWRIQAR